jgi:acetolactate synthase small subunit
MTQTFVASVNRTPGILARVDALFRRQDVAVDSLAYDAEGGTRTASLTIVAEATDEKARLLVRHLERLVDVRSVEAQPAPVRASLCIPV